MDRISSRMPPGRPRGLCVLCGAPVKDPTARSGDDAYLCGPHAVEQLAADTRKREEAYRIACLEPRAETLKALQRTMPWRYSEVRDPAEGDGNEMAAALNLLSQRVRCADVESAIVATREAAEHVATVRGAVVLFAGITGTGKSTLAALLLNLVVNSIPLLPVARNPMIRKGGLFGQPWPFFDDCDPFVYWIAAKKLFAAAAAKEDEVRLTSFASLAVVDDIGNEPTQQNLKPVSDVIWQRHDDGRATVLTSGWVDEHADPNDLDAFLSPLKGRYDEAFVRRIAKDRDFCRVIPLVPVS